jgi:hypothetical protein
MNSVMQRNLDFMFAALKVIFTVILYTVGIAIGLISAAIGMLNCGLEAFVAGAAVYLIWNGAFTYASPYMAAPITYLQAVGLFVLFKIFFGGNNKPVDFTPKMETNRGPEALLEALRKGPKTTPGAGYTPGPRQAYRPDQVDQGQPGYDPGRGPGVGGRNQGAKAGA